VIELKSSTKNDFLWIHDQRLVNYISCKIVCLPCCEFV